MVQSRICLKPDSRNVILVKSIIFLTALLIAAVAEARLAGSWVGWGQWSFKGDGVRCSPMQMQWSESANTIAIEKGYFDCDVVAMELGHTAWTINDGRLFDENQKEVGRYDGNYFEVEMPSPNENTMIQIRVRREANHYDYEEIWYNTHEKIYVIEGRLFNSGETK